VNRCWKTLRVEGYSAAGWGIGGFFELLLWFQGPHVRAMDSQ